MARWQLKMAFLQTLARRRAGGKTQRRTFLPARPRMRDFEFSLAILHPTPLRKGMRDTKMARWQLKMAFLQTLARRRAGGKTQRRTFLPARPRMRDFEFSLAILHPTPLRKGMRDTKMARWQLKMAFFANPSCVRRKKTFAKKNFLRTREKV